MTQDQLKSHHDNPRLDSWKQIASYLGCEERTAKRWESARGLPVHRLPGGRSGVFAYVREIESWQKYGEVRPAEDPIEGSAEAPPDASLPVPEPSASPVGRRFEFRPSYAYILALVVIGLIAAPLLFSRRSVSHAAPQAGKAMAMPAHVPPKEAEDLYLNGRYFWNKRDAPDLRTALGLFQRAVQRDPQYALAYVGLADTYALLVEYAALPPSEAYPPAIAAARRAIALDPSLPEAHRALAFSSFYWSWDRPLSEREFRKAIALNPQDATSYLWFANTLMTSQRAQDALAEIEKARRLDPTAISILADRAHILYSIGRKQEARDVLLEVERVDPSFLSAHRYLAEIDHSERDYPAYLEELKRIAAITRRDVDVRLYEAAEKGFASGGENGLLNALAEEDLTLFRQGSVPAFDVASALASSGKNDRAIQYLKMAYANRDTQFLTLKAPGSFPTLRNNPEFQELAEKSAEPWEHAQVAELDASTK